MDEMSLLRADDGSVRMTGGLEEPPPGYVETHIGDQRLFQLESPTCQLPGLGVGYWMRGGDPDIPCAQAAWATLLQEPTENIPREGTRDGRADFYTSLEQRGIEVDYVEGRPGQPPPPGFAIGVTDAAGEALDPGRHTIILRDGLNFFDPAMGILWPDGRPPARVRAVEFAVTIKRRNLC
jgi:hypothetical protein